MIPKIIHQIWYQGENAIPDKLRGYMNNCKEINSDYQHYIWDGEMLERFIEDSYPQYVETYKSFPLMIQKIDFAKYLILHNYGGVYVDMDVECIKQVEKMIYLFNGKDMLVVPAPKEIPFELYNTLSNFFFKFKVTETDRYINNGTIVAKKNHNFFLFLCDEIARRLPKYKYNFITKYISRDGYVWTSTGPGIFTECIFLYRKKNKENIEIIDEKYMEPCSELTENCNLSEAYFNHKHERSWVGIGEFFVIFQRGINFVKKYTHNVLVVIILVLMAILVYFNNNKKQWDKFKLAIINSFKEKKTKGKKIKSVKDGLKAFGKSLKNPKIKNPFKK